MKVNQRESLQVDEDGQSTTESATGNKMVSSFLRYWSGADINIKSP